MFLIDTNICIYIMNIHPPEVIQKFRQIGVGNICISSITVSELQYGACKSKEIKKNIKRLDEFLSPFDIIVGSGTQLDPRILNNFLPFLIQSIKLLLYFL